MKKALTNFTSFVLLLAAVFFGTYFGSDIIEDYIDGKMTEKLKAEAQSKYSDCVGFSIGEEYASDGLRAVKTDVLRDYESDYAHCSSRILYERLANDKEKTVYRAFEYAFDNTYNYIFFSKNVFGDDIDYGRILHLFVMDSPIAAQSIAYSVSGKPGAYMDASYTYENSKGKKVDVCPEGYLVSVSSFKNRSREKCDEAYNKALSIVSAMPEGLTDMEKAKYLYKYLCANAIYKDYDEGVKGEPLYDALIKGETVCDGFANALSMLYNLAEIPCFEKLHIADEDEDAGHTWNCFSIDGVWYNADPTFNSSLEEGSALELALEGFGFSDKYQRFQMEFEDIMPECTEDTLYANREYLPKSTDEHELLGALIQSWRDSGKTAGCVITDNMSDEEFAALKEKMRYDDRIPEVDTYYFFSVWYPDCEALLFVDSTDY